MKRTLRHGAVIAAALALCWTAVAVAGTFVGDDGPNTITGTSGRDSLYGRGGNDTLRGLAGDDDLDGGPGADVLEGGPGNDAVSYAASAAGVSVTFDNRADDGAPGESDNVHSDVESAYGGPGDDTLTGNGADNTLDGGAGNDRLVGGKGNDGLYGGPGDDFIDAKDGVIDTVDCGPGTDRVNADRFDKTAHCEQRGSGAVLPAAKATGGVTNLWTSGATTRVDILTIHDIVPAGATVRVRCTGGGCPFGNRTFRPSGGSVRLAGVFRGHQLRPGGVIVIVIGAPGHTSKWVSFTMRRHQIPKFRSACAAPGSLKPVRCP